MNIEQLNELLDENKKEQKKKEMERKKQAALNWISNNKEIAGAAAVVGGKILWDVYKTAKGHAAAASEDKRREKRTYDPRSGQYYDLKRKLSNSEKEYVSSEMARGRLKADILRELKVI